MNKCIKFGLSALCGSLATVSAVNAGSLDVTGSSEVSYTSLGNKVTGNPIGMNTGLSFTGNGELDGGQTFSVLVAHTDKLTYSSANITLNTNSVGTFKLSSAEGGAGIGGYDDNMPRAWEEVWDNAITTNVNLQKGVSSSTNVSWTSPAAFGSTLQVAYTPDNDGSANANKGISGDTGADNYGRGVDVVLDINPQWDAFGFNAIVGASQTKHGQVNATQLNNAGHLKGYHEEAVVGLTFTFGPLQLGGQVSAESTKANGFNETEYYGNSSWGVAFNVNDSFSLSYSEARHIQSKTKKKNIAVGGDVMTPKAKMTGKSLQATYTIGGVGLKYASTRYDNTAYGGFDTAEVPLQSRIFAVSLAF